MNYNLVKDILTLLETFEQSNTNQHYNSTVEGFCQWIIDTKSQSTINDIDWDGKIKGRSIESVISTLLAHMGKYAKSYSKSAIHNSDFSSQEDFIYLITLNSFGSMSKTELIKRNKMDKPTGVKIINRLIKSNWVIQIDSTKDKRSKILALTADGEKYLAYKMDDIRKASKIVTADLTHKEKVDLVHILSKMDKFHQKIYDRNLSPEQLLLEAYESYTIANN